MLINHDKSYITSKDLMASGYAAEDLHSLRFNFEYSEAEKAANAAERPRIDALPSDERDAFFREVYLFRSETLHTVMEAISRQFVCYQYDHNKDDRVIPYDSDQWDLFFWCNDFYNTFGGKLSGRDYSYFTLTFNNRMSMEQRLDVCNRVIHFLTENFADNDHLRVAVQYCTNLFDKKIADDAQAILPTLVGKKCTYARMEGKIVQTELGVFFVKKYARSKGYKLTDIDILRLSWALNVA